MGEECISEAKIREAKKKILGSNKILRLRAEWPAHTGRPFRALRKCITPERSSKQAFQRSEEIWNRPSRTCGGKSVEKVSNGIRAKTRAENMTVKKN